MLIIVFPESTTPLPPGRRIVRFVRRKMAYPPPPSEARDSVFANHEFQSSHSNLRKLRGVAPACHLRSPAGGTPWVPFPRTALKRAILAGDDNLSLNAHPDLIPKFSAL